MDLNHVPPDYVNCKLYIFKENYSFNMEVHKHPHHVTHPKKWFEYFLEFFMLFLAVFLGFLAENIRENFVEKERVRDYAQSLYDDLKVDTAIIQRTYAEKDWIKPKYDSAEAILFSTDLKKYNELIYYVERYINLNDIFTAQDVTYQQLKSSGNFRYIKNISLYKNIANYYTLYSRYQYVDGNFSGGSSEMSEIESKIFDLKYLTSLNNHNGKNFYSLILRPDKKLEPLINDKQSLKILYLKFDNAKNRVIGAKIFLLWLKSNATNLLSELNSEYHLK